MRLRLVTTAVLLILAALAVAQTVEEPPPAESEAEQRLPGQTALRALVRAPLQLGADLGNACICLCRQADPPNSQHWGYYERSIISGCQWSGRVCVTGGQLGTLGACAEAPAPLD